MRYKQLTSVTMRKSAVFHHQDRSIVSPLGFRKVASEKGW
jgi:hypothetical protein